MTDLKPHHQSKEQLLNELYQRAKIMDDYMKEKEALDIKFRATAELELHDLKEQLNALKIKQARHERDENAHKI